ncbi:MAG: DUF2089 domain-containing protein [Candidatus Zixiibacteriota bacterium]
MKKILTNCPVCDGDLEVTEYRCAKCGIKIQGKFKQNLIARLSPKDAEFVKVFLAAHGSIKEVERILGISYPTVKSRLDQINAAIGNPVSGKKSVEHRLDILGSIENGELSVEEALKRLKKE